MKKYPIVEVEWIDAHGGGISWDAGIDKISQEPDKVRTVGFLVGDTDEGVTVVLSMTQRGHVDAYIFIPRPCITKYGTIKGKKL